MARKKMDEERLLTISFIYHGLDDHWKHAPVQVKVQLGRKGGENSQTELEGGVAASSERDGVVARLLHTDKRTRKTDTSGCIFPLLAK